MLREEVKCVTFAPDSFVQLGYNATGKGLLFIPLLGAGGIAIPDRGVLIDDEVVDNLAPLQVAESKPEGGDISVPRMVVH